MTEVLETEDYTDEQRRQDAETARHAAACLVHADLLAYSDLVINHDAHLAEDALALAMGLVWKEDDPSGRNGARMAYLVESLAGYSSFLLRKGGMSYEDAVQYAWANVEKTRPDYDVLARGESVADPVAAP